MNKTTLCALSVLLLSCRAETAPTSVPDKPREVDFAEKVILSNWVIQLSPTARAARQRCGETCIESGTVEMGISLLGVGGEATTQGLLNMLALRLDADASEEMHCQFLNRGKSIMPQLQRLSAARASSWCHQTFKEARNRELSAMTDVPVEKVCRTPADIDHERTELLDALKSSAGCEY